jgi:hypothetical protein
MVSEDDEEDILNDDDSNENAYLAHLSFLPTVPLFLNSSARSIALTLVWCVRLCFMCYAACVRRYTGGVSRVFVHLAVLLRSSPATGLPGRDHIVANHRRLCHRCEYVAVVSIALRVAEFITHYSLIGCVQGLFRSA